MAKEVKGPSPQTPTIATHTVTLTPIAAQTPPPTGPAALAFTGSPWIFPALIAAILLIALGAALLRITRRKARA